MGVEIINQPYQPVPTTEDEDSLLPPPTPSNPSTSVIVEDHASGEKHGESFCSKLKVFKFKLCILMIILLQSLPLTYSLFGPLFIAPILGVVVLFTRSTFLSALHFISAILYYAYFGYTFAVTVYLAVANTSYVGSSVTCGVFFIIFTILLKAYFRYLLLIRTLRKEKEEADKHNTINVTVNNEEINNTTPSSPSIYPGNHFQQQQYIPPPSHHQPVFHYYGYPPNFPPQPNQSGQPQQHQFVPPTGYYFVPIPQQQQQQQ